MVRNKPLEQFELSYQFRQPKQPCASRRMRQCPRRLLRSPNGLPMLQSTSRRPPPWPHRPNPAPASWPPPPLRAHRQDTGQLRAPPPHPVLRQARARQQAQLNRLLRAKHATRHEHTPRTPLAHPRNHVRADGGRDNAQLGFGQRHFEAIYAHRHITDRAMPTPPPKALPCSRPISGLGNRLSAPSIVASLPASAARVAASMPICSCIQPRSPPAQNVLPAAARITTRTASSAAKLRRRLRQFGQHLRRQRVMLCSRARVRVATPRPSTSMASSQTSYRTIRYLNWLQNTDHPRIARAISAASAITSRSKPVLYPRRARCAATASVATLPDAPGA